MECAQPLNKRAKCLVRSPHRHAERIPLLYDSSLSASKTCERGHGHMTPTTRIYAYPKRKPISSECLIGHCRALTNMFCDLDASRDDGVHNISCEIRVPGSSHNASQEGAPESHIVPRSSQGVPHRQVCHRHEGCHIATVALASHLPFVCAFPRRSSGNSSENHIQQYFQSAIWNAHVMARNPAGGPPPNHCFVRKQIPEQGFSYDPPPPHASSGEDPSLLSSGRRSFIVSSGQLTALQRLLCKRGLQRTRYTSAHRILIIRCSVRRDIPPQNRQNARIDEPNGSKGTRTLVRLTTWDPKLNRRCAFANKHA